MINYIRSTWKELDRSIFEGDRLEKNLWGITVAAVLIVIVSVITGYMNLVTENYEVAATAPVGIVAGLLAAYFAGIRKKRMAAAIVLLLDVGIVYTYDAFFSTNGFTIYWTLLFPLAICYLASVKAGILFSLYFLVLYIILFMTPVQQFVAGNYSDIVVERFPILYLIDFILTTYIMLQYHKSTLHQLDYAKQLIAAKEEAEQANKAKSDFLTDMSHEIRTPINAVLGMNEMIMRESMQAKESVDPEDTPLAESFQNITNYAGNIEGAGNNLLNIINDVLDFSKIESGKMEIIESSYKFSSVLHDVCNMIFFKAREKGLEFKVDVDETLPDCMYGDEVRIQQVLVNVLNNAVKYTGHGSVKLTVRGDIEGERKAGRTIVLTFFISDTGIGIKQEDIEKLFTKFRRVDLEHNSTVEGTGLGLAITQNLLDMMGGSVQVTSEYGVGSTFTIKLPQIIVSDEEIGDFQKRFEENMLEAKKYKESFQAPDAHILIVDDTKINLKVALGLLRNTKMQIDTAGGGEKALELTYNNRYDLILMDQRMPEMDGTETLRHIKNQINGNNIETPIICLTADAIIGAKERYIEEGFTDYLTKPINSADLEMMLIKYLPEDKVQLYERKASDSAEAQPGFWETDDRYESLRAAGIDPKVGLGYSQNDETLYQSLLLDYAQDATNKLQSLQIFYEKGDWKNYGILSHAIKSTSRMIGAGDLSEVAAQLEAASNDGNDEIINRNHDIMKEQYEKVAQSILAAFEPFSEAAADEDEILEFFPE